MIEKPAKVPQREITSLDIVSFDGGRDERVPQNAESNTFTSSRNMVVTSQGLLTHRHSLKKWLPDTVGTVHQVFPVLYDGDMYYLVADDNKVKYVQTGDTTWTDCGTLDTTATLSTSLTGSNNDLVFTAVDSGASGNDITVTYVDPGGNDQVLGIVVAGTDITVNLATDSGGAITTIANDIITAIEASSEASELVTIALKAGSDGTGVVTALAETNLAGGTDGTNQVTTGDGVINTFLRIQDKVLVLNGSDKLRYIDLTTMEMVQFSSVTDPGNAPTVAATGITASGAFKIYYGVTFNSTVGETAISPILTQAISKSRSTWKDDGTEYLTVTRNNTAPTGAVSWNLYMALAPAGASIAATDMLPLAVGLDLTETTFVDNGTIPVNLSRGTAPQDNSTDGPSAKFGIETNGRPILWGDPNQPYTLFIGGDGDYPLDFTPTNGGYRLELNKGTNYYPMSVVGFRNGQGTPSLTVLFSNTQGLSKQSIIEQQTVTYGNFSFVVWTTTEQNYGASGVAGPYAVVNYQGALIFLSVDGGMSMDTEASMQNVLSTRKITNPIEPTYKSINPEYLGSAVGCAWSNVVYFSAPTQGYPYNNEILMYDMTNKDKPKWYSADIRAQWIGVVSPSDRGAFVYVCQDNHIFRLQENFVAVDQSAEGSPEAFPVEARGSFAGLNKAHNNYTAIVQVMFYLVEAIGTVEVGVSYRVGNRIKTKTKVVNIGEYLSSYSGGWSDPQYLYQAGVSAYNQWSNVATVSDATLSQKRDIRIPLQLGGVITNEMQWYISSDTINSSFILRSVSYEGVNIGIRADLV